MEQVELIPFSGLVAGVLLYKRECTSVEFVNIISKLEQLGIVVDDENDDLEELFCCVEVNQKFDFCLKDGIDYETVLLSGVKVVTFLKRYTNERILTLLSQNVKDFLSVEQLLQLVASFEGKVVDEKNRKGIFGGKRKILTKTKDVCHHLSFGSRKKDFSRAVIG